MLRRRLSDDLRQGDSKLVNNVKKTSKAFKPVWDELRRHRILLLSDPILPSVCSLVVGSPVRGSWWGHPRGHEIFAVTEALADHPDVLATKLVSVKVTFVHRDLWPELLAVGRAREPWQIKDLSRTARLLLNRLAKAGELRTDRISSARQSKSSSTAEAARQLEEKILIYCEQFHTETGAHAKRLESWEHWARRTGFVCEKMSPENAKKQFEEVLHALNAQFDARGRLPW